MKDWIRQHKEGKTKVNVLKRATFELIFKEGYKKLLENYRSISVLQILSKIAEKYIALETV